MFRERRIYPLPSGGVGGHHSSCKCASARRSRHVDLVRGGGLPIPAVAVAERPGLRSALRRFFVSPLRPALTDRGNRRPREWVEMKVDEVERAVRATTELASALGLSCGEARIVWNSNKLALRLLPCDVFARVAFVGQEVFHLEIEIARPLAVNQSPVAALDTRVEPRVYERDGFAFTLWRYYEQSGIEASAAAYAKALARVRA